MRLFQKLVSLLNSVIRWMLQVQLLWKNYFRALAIPQRINECQQRHMMPRRYWKHLTEME